MTYRNRARNTLASMLAAVAMTSLLLNVLIRTAMPEWADPEYGIRMKRLRSESSRDPGKPVVLALGSSRLQMALDPNSMDDADRVLFFNGGQSGCGPRQTLANFRRYRVDGVQPHALIVEILPALLTGDLPLLDDWTEFFAPWSAHRSRLLSQAGAGRYQARSERCDYLWKQMKPGGWMPYFHESISDAKRTAGLAVARAEYAPKLQQCYVANDVRGTYVAFLAEAQANTTPVLFVLLPESPTFRHWVGPGFEPMLQAYLAELRHEADVIDARDWFADETCFADGHHLMRHAATSFSKRFGAVHVEPWLRRTGIVATP